MDQANQRTPPDTSRIKGWPADSYAAIVGLDQRRTATGDKNAYTGSDTLAKADIDRATGGMVFLKTQLHYFEGSRIPQKIDVAFATQEINGRRSVQHLFQIENRLDKKNREVYPHKIYFLGEAIFDAEKQGDFHIGDINSVHQALQELHRLMRPPHDTRQGEYSVTNTLKILLDNNLNHIMGQDLAQKFGGINEKGRFDFDYSGIFNKKAANDNVISLPSRDFARAVIGDTGVNTLDYSHKEGVPAPRFATHKASGILYGTQDQRKHLKTRLSQQSALSPVGPTPADIRPLAIPSLLSLQFQSAQRGEHVALEQKLESVHLFGSKLDPDNLLEQSRSLLFANRYNLDIAAGKYPAVMSHLIEADLHERAYDLVPPERGSVRVDMIRRMGNPEGRPVIAGMGDQLGDSTMFMHRRTGADGKVYAQGLGIDLGLSFAPKNSEYSGAVPDILADLEKFDDLLLTHHHADHSGGIPIYVDSGLLSSPEHYARLQDGLYRGKTLHGTAKQILRIKAELQRGSIDPEKWPKFNELKGNGWLHIRNKETRELCFSVHYTAGTIPHTARTNGFGIIAYNGNQIQFAVKKLGDMRFGKHGDDDKARSPIPSAELLDRAWLAQGLACLLDEQQRMFEHGEITAEEMVTPEHVQGRRWMLEVDGTNFKKPGFARTEVEAEENEILIKKELHPEKMAIVSMMSTTDAGFERELRVAVQTHAHFSLVGANLETAGAINNKTGVNLELLEMSEDGVREVQNYLDWAYQALYGIDYETLEVDLDAVIEDYKACKNAAKKDEYIRNLISGQKDAPQTARAVLFAILSQNKAANFRYAAQMRFEALSEEILGEKMMLGSIFVGRDSQTFKSMVSTGKERVRACVTGTQGTENEQEAATFKHFSGRGIFNANPKNRKTAVPLKSGDYFWTIAQGAIPGNEGDRHDLERLGAELGFPLYSALGDGFVSYNSGQDRPLRALVARQNGICDYDMNGNLVVSNMPIYPSGHGHKGDALAFLDIIEPEFAYLVHTDDHEAHMEFLAEMRRRGTPSVDEPVKNFHYYTLKSGDTPQDAACEELGRIFPSLVLLREVRPWNQHFGGYTLAQKVVAIDGEGGVVSDALMAGENLDPQSHAPVFSHFGAVNRQEEDRASEKRKPNQRRSPAETEGIQEDKLYKGAYTPRHEDFDEDDEAFQSRLRELGL